MIIARRIIHFYSSGTFSFRTSPDDTLPLAISREILYFCSSNEAHKTPLFLVVFFEIHFRHVHYRKTYADRTVPTAFCVTILQRAQSPTVHRNQTINLSGKMLLHVQLNDVFPDLTRLGFRRFRTVRFVFFSSRFGRLRLPPNSVGAERNETNKNI